MSDTAEWRRQIDDRSEAPLSAGSRVATAALAVAFVVVIVVLLSADRAIVTASPVVGAIVPGVKDTVLRAGMWTIGLTALGALVIGLTHERRLTRRVAERSAELERLSAELIRVNRAKSEFLANVSHELRTPLNAIVGFVDLLQDGVYGELAPRQAGPVQRIAASAAHLRTLVDQILDLAKIAAGRLEVHPEPVELSPFVLDVATEVEPLITERGLALTLAVPNTMPRPRTDPSHLRQILVNLLGNAVKFTPEGRITVRATFVDRDAPDSDPRGERPGSPRPRGGGGRAAPSRRWLAERAPETGGGRYWIALQVIDTGVGIAPGDQERIFDEFEQVGPRAGDSAQRGTGLGLAISRRLARLLGGDLTLDSALGEGTTFVVWLPIDAADVPTA
ncbi:ATP-binding region ATPase domain protein [Gemmatirosa kalamazoonensis]|uniref:histidine kinase n=1 Tax=Gemmatirosa kalamazoonensis TaxID=861299 RepID=W0RH29_9BACT|nr:ATP-binding protein [Gemmatirosa kalamazoonensis]AHG88683.1 ATP-binding region ATPase domain protein [Gemmatirosa kalamazoonensis]